ncbi:O-methyltransferase gsfB [Erysiphe neolycopersici]|uniref:O-methyltransferase gsfB n=1 Tax=Erysiphe neolycopersici TaxID=212602 RepID=A0A420HWH7_9PEZI|nr:O-methyltransferase gsfB [Erysiphe neolycopersici]
MTKSIKVWRVMSARQLTVGFMEYFSLRRSISHKVNLRKWESRSSKDIPLYTCNPALNPEEEIQSNDDKNTSISYRVQLEEQSSFLLKLAHTIAKETKKLNGWLRESGAPELGFGVDSPLEFPLKGDEIEKSRSKIIKATEELSALVMGPADSIRWMAWGASLPLLVLLPYNDAHHSNSLSLHAIYHYKIVKSFPIHETASFAQISKRIGLSELNVRRFLRHAMTNRIFKEIKPGVVAHTAASRILAENSKMDDWVGFCVEEMWQAAAMTISALERNPQADDPKQTGFCLSNSTTDVETMFTTFEKSPFRSARMGGAMHSLTDGPGYELTHLLSSYDWLALDKYHGLIVDIGGSHGFVSIALASKFPRLRFIVQDTPTTIASAPPLSKALSRRIRFQVHDFHTTQNVKGADVYFFRWIFHNHSDRLAIPMLRNLIPALKRGARVLINDYCLLEPASTVTKLPSVDPTEEKTLRSMDLAMLSLLNSQERDENEYRMLFKAADERFQFIGVRTSVGSSMALIEAIWAGQDFCQTVD